MKKGILFVSSFLLLVSLTCCTSNREKLFEAMINNDVDRDSDLLESDIDINAMNK